MFDPSFNGFDLLLIATAITVTLLYLLSEGRRS